MAVEDFPVHRNLSARLDAQAIADVNPVQSDFLVVAAGAHARRRRWRELEQCLDRAVGARSRAQLENLPHEDQRHDHGRRLEIERRHAVHLESIRQNLGEQQSDDAEHECRGDTQADQAEHVEAPGSE